jgi:hypothetical protein
VRSGFSPEDPKIGDGFRERIEESIRVFDKVVNILSEHSVRSAWPSVGSMLRRKARKGKSARSHFLSVPTMPSWTFHSRGLLTFGAQDIFWIFKTGRTATLTRMREAG